MGTVQEKTTAIKVLETTKKVRPMIKEWNRRALEAQASGEPIAYYFIASYYEDILRAMDIISVGTENYAAVCAAKMDAERFLSKAQSEGYASHLCTYATCWIGFDAMYKELGEMPPNAPDGGLPRPTVLLGTGMMICDPRYKGYQASRRYTGAPMHTLSLPWPPADANLKEVESYYIKYITEELAELVQFLEKHTGRKMNWERLSEVTDLIEQTLKVWNDAYWLRRGVPAPMPTEDAMTTMVPGWFYLGTQQAYDFYHDLYNEIKYRLDNKMGVIPDERYRLLWGGGLPPWFALRLFNYFESLGAVFPYEVTYIPPSVVEIPKGVSPLERIAWRFFRQNTGAEVRVPYPPVEWYLDTIDNYKIDGIVFHRAYTCRTLHCGQIHVANLLREQRDIPILILEGDIVNPSYYNEAQVKGRIDAFIEVVDAYKKRKG